MNSITVSAKTVSDAITEASIQLGVVSTSMEYRVIEEGSAGFLGIGRKQAVIEAWKKEEKVEPKKEFKQNKKEFKKEMKETKKEAKPVKPEKVVEKPAEKPVEKVVEKVVEEKEEKEEKLCEVKPETITACETFLKDVLKTMDMEVEITSCIDEDGALSINMDGDNMGILIGKRGQTLEAEDKDEAIVVRKELVDKFTFSGLYKDTQEMWEDVVYYIKMSSNDSC